jgi:predicted Zn finger-like uncharacterized protein
MIINCINCNKKFNVNDELIPVNGRQIACGSCNHSWYFQVDKNTEKTSLTQSVSVAQDEITSENNEKNFEISSEDKNSKFIKNKSSQKDNKTKVELLNKNKYKTQNTRTSNFLSYLLVFIISFIAIIIAIDTLKIPLINFFPGLEIILFNLFEILKDVKLFIIDLT